LCKWVENIPKFDGDPLLAISHVVNSLKYISEINVVHEDVLMRLFYYSLGANKRDWVLLSCNPKSIYSISDFIEKPFSSVGAQYFRGMKTIFKI
jgi:hypothetical protein